jgi:spectrin beta
MAPASPPVEGAAPVGASAVSPSPVTSPEAGTDSEAGKERDGDELEGMLVRKHEWENTTKKASNRSWDKVCVVLKEDNLRFYKDQKSYRTSPDTLYRGEPALEMAGAKAEIATDYTKKKHVFRLKCANGGESLFQASDEDEMTQWVNSINQVAEAGASGSAAGGRAQTLPAGQGPRGDEPKKRSFFTLKKK